MKEINELDLRSKKYIIFDMDGTLIDSVGVWNRVDQKLIEEYGQVTVDLDVVQVERHAFLHDHLDSDIYLAYCNYLIEKYSFKINDADRLLKIRWEISNEILENEMDFKPDVVDLIFKLKKIGFILVLATMTTQLQLDVYSKKNRKMLSQMNIREAFDLIITKDEVKNKKPHSEIYDKIVQYYNTIPDKCLIFEDSYTGVLAANHAGVEVVNIYDRYANIDRNKIDELVDYKITEYKEFIDFVNALYLN